MGSVHDSALAQEWATLQNNHERYEHSTLIVKLVAIVLFTIGVLWPHGAGLLPHVFLGILCFAQCLLWLQEAILRTSQARLGERLLRIEALMRATGDDHLAGSHALQLHGEWLAHRPGTPGLLREYAANALRPTVAVPHAALAAVLVALMLCH
ncbi:MAG: hypothetical protein JWL63_724 [Rhodocyclales bacterium]|nr:hypothetical protein [Rhodocyclales bacterium]